MTAAVAIEWPCPGWYHQEWNEFLASSNNGTHSHGSVLKNESCDISDISLAVWLPGRSRTWIPWPSPRDRGTKPRTHCCVRACFRQKSRPSREPTQKPCIADAVSGVQIRTRNENWQEQCGFTISGKPAPSCSKIQALRIKPSATALRLTTLLSSRMHFHYCPNDLSDQVAFEIILWYQDVSRSIKGKGSTFTTNIFSGN